MSFKVKCLIVVAFFLSVLVFYQNVILENVLSFSVRSIAKIASNSQIGFRSLRIKDGHIVLDKAHYKNDLIDVKVKQVKIDLDIFHLQANLKIINPKVYLEKASFLDKLNSKKTFLDLTYEVEDGLIFLNNEKIHFTLNKGKKLDLLLGFKDKGQIKIDYSKKVYALFNDVSTDYLASLMEFFSIPIDIPKVSGILQGYFLGDTEQFYSDLHFSNLVIPGQGKMERLDLQLEYPFDSGLDFLSHYDFPAYWKQLRVYLVIKGGNYKNLENMEGTFSFSSDIGPRGNFLALAGKNSPISLDVKGFLSSQDKPWIDVEMNFLNDISSITAKISQIENKKEKIDFYLKGINPAKKQILSDLLGIFFPLLLDFSHEGGTIDLNGAITIVDKKIEKISLLDIDLNHIGCSYSPYFKEAFFHALKGDLSFELKKKNPLINGYVQLEQAEVKTQGVRVDQLSCDIKIENDLFYPSNLTMRADDISINLSFEGFFNDLSILGKVEGQKKDLNIDSFVSDFTLLKKQEALFLSGKIQVEKDVFSYEADFNRICFDITNALNRAKLKGKKILLENYQPLFSYFDKDLKIEGKVDIDAEYLDDKLSFGLLGDYLFLQNDIGKATFCSGINCKELTIDLLSGNLSGFFDLQKVNIYLEKPDLDFTNVDGTMFFERRAADIDIHAAKTCGIDFSAYVYLDFLEKEAFRIDLASKSAAGSLSSFRDLFSKFDLTFLQDMDIDAQVTLGKKDFIYSQIFSITDPQNYFNFQAKVKNGFMNLFRGIKLKDLSVDVCFNEEKIDLSSIRGKLLLGKKEYGLHCPTLLKKGDWKFDIHIDDSFYNIACISGIAKETKNSLDFIFKEDLTHVMGTKLHIKSLLFENGLLSQFEMHPNMVNLDDKIRFVSSILPPNNIEIPKVHGNIACKAILENKELIRLSFQSDNLQIGDTKFNDLSSFLDFKKDTDKWKIPHFNIEADKAFCFISSGEMVVKDLKFEGNIHKFFIDLQKLDTAIDLSGQLEANGKFSLDLLSKEKEFDLELDFNKKQISIQDFVIENNNFLQISCNFSKGLWISGIDAEIHWKELLYHFISGPIFYDFCTKKWIAKKNNLYFSKTNLEKKFSLDLSEDISLRCNLEYDMKDLKIFFPDKQFLFLGPSFDTLEDISCKISPDGAHLKGDFHEKNYFFHSKYDFVNGTYEVSFLDKDIENIDPLTIYGNWSALHGAEIESIAGSFCGIEASFCKNIDIDSTKEIALQGGAKIDFQKAAPFLSESFKEILVDKLSMKEGYDIHGFFRYDKKDKFSFSGNIIGRNFSMLGCRLKTLFSTIYMNEKDIKLTNLKISDPAGMVKIDSLYCEEDKEGRSILSIPHFRLYEFRPSLLDVIGKSKQQIEPFLVRDLTLLDLKGDIDEIKTITGHGKIDFINSFKRENTIFDIPVEFLGRIFGLDLELLVPVKGSLDYKIAEGKCFFQNLKNSFSENDRSKFFFAEEKSNYLDLNGNLNIHVKMKQYVLFKITEQFIISIQGDIYHPDYRLQKKISENAKAM